MKRLNANERKTRGIAGFECRFNPQLTISAAAADGGDGGKLPSFQMLAYNGGKLGQRYGVTVVDLATVLIRATTPILFNHDSSQPVGYGVVANDGKTLHASGVISFGGTSPAAQQIIEGGRNGFPWQASIGGGESDTMTVDEVAPGEIVEVNGQELQGPFYLFRNMSLNEISIVVNGADSGTSTTIQATAEQKGKKKMPNGIFAKIGRMFIQAADEQPDEEKQTQAEEQPAGEEEQKDDDEQEGQKQTQASATPARVKAQACADPVRAQMQAAAEAQRRINELNKICASQPEILVKALDEGWSTDKANLEVLRASRPVMVNTGAGRPDAQSANVVTAAICASGKLPGLEQQFDAKTLEAAHQTYRGALGLEQIILAAAASGGYTGFSNFKADSKGILQAAFSAGNLSGVLSNIANKFLLAGFRSYEDSWRGIAAIRNVSDFKEITSYALTGDMKYELVGAGGKIHSGTLGDTSYTNRARTYAKILSITRQDIINDDLGALTQVPQMHGRGAALAFNEIFWSTFLSNSSFFTSARKNYFGGATSALSIDSLTTAEQMFLNQTDPDGNPLGLTPRILLVPNALNTTASAIMKSTELRIDGSAEKSAYVTVNPHAGKFDVIRSSYLSSAKLTGHSTAAWYLLASPQEMPTIEACFLDGKEMPTIEEAEADFDTLGVQMRGFHDFGVAMQEYRAGVKSKGSA